MDVSVVIPAYNEEGNVEQLYKELRTVLGKLRKNYELIFIDDGSSDSTLDKLRSLRKKDKKVKVISFQRNFGKAAALTAGFKHANGKLIFTMDADLQDDPAEIPSFITKINDGYDLVSGWKYRRRDPLTKKIPSKFFNWLTAKTTGVNIHDSNCGFKCYRKEVLDKVHIYGELHRYIPALAHWKGFGVGEVRVNHRPRTSGKSKYGFTRLFKGFLDLITIKYLTTYMRRPAHLFGFAGFGLSVIGLLSGLYLIYLKIIGQTIGDRPLLFLTVLLALIGVQFISLGLLGEMIANQFKKEDEYVIQEVLK